jgi:DNA-directed RNA polymerase specialized sigma24 family protein
MRDTLIAALAFVVVDEPIPGEAELRGLLGDLLGPSADEYRDGGIAKAELRIDLEAAIARLTPEQHEAVYWWLLGYSQRGTAERLGVDQSTVSRRLGGALAHIRGWL